MIGNSELQERMAEQMEFALSQTPEALAEDNAKLRELAKGMYGMLATVDAILGNHDACETPRPLIFGENKSFKDAMRELGVIE